MTRMGPGNRKHTILSPARCQWNDSRSSGGKKETNFPNHLFSDKEQIYKPTLLSIFQQEKVVLGQLITQMLHLTGDLCSFLPCHIQYGFQKNSPRSCV